MTMSYKITNIELGIFYVFSLVHLPNATETGSRRTEHATKRATRMLSFISVSCTSVPNGWCSDPVFVVVRLLIAFYTMQPYRQRDRQSSFNDSDGSA